jgi:hypothetical protein
VADTAAYQIMMRSALRDPANKKPVTVYLPDNVGLASLQRLIPDFTVEELKVDGLNLPKRNGRPRKFANDTIKKQVYRLRERRQEIIDADTMPVKVFAGDIFDSILSPKARCSLPDMPIEELVATLWSFHGERYDKKDQIKLISPSHFNPNVAGTNTKRGLKNILYVNHFWMDFENGTLKTQELAAVFPHWKMVITNSFRHTHEAPRFHVFIPTRRWAPAAYKLFHDWIEDQLVAAGYENHGLDASRKPACSLLYLPSQAKDSSQSFFDFYDSLRTVFDPLEWIDDRIAELEQQ